MNNTRGFSLPDMLTHQKYLSKADSVAQGQKRGSVECNREARTDSFTYGNMEYDRDDFTNKRREDGLFINVVREQVV